MKKFTKGILSTLEIISLHGAAIYGGASLIIRNQFNNKEGYRVSRDVDIKKINVIIENSEQKLKGPTSQFEPIDIIGLISEELGDSLLYISKIKNTSASLTQEYELEIKNFGNIIFEFYSEKNYNENEIENINGINFVKLEKVFADKLFASVDYYYSGTLGQENRIRHIVDMLQIVKEYNIDINLTWDFIKKRIDKEINLINSKSDEKYNDRKLHLTNICSDFKNKSIELLETLLLNDEFEVDLNFNDELLKDGLYEKRKFLTKKTYDLLINVIDGGYE